MISRFHVLVIILPLSLVVLLALLVAGIHWYAHAPRAALKTTLSNNLAMLLLDDAAAAALVCGRTDVIAVVHPEFVAKDFTKKYGISDYQKSPFARILLRPLKDSSASGTAIAHIDGRGIDDNHEMIASAPCNADISFEYSCGVEDNGVSASFGCNIVNIRLSPQ